MVENDPNRARQQSPPPAQESDETPGRHLAAISAALRSKWAPSAIPLSLLLAGPALRLVGAHTGWGTLLIVCGTIGGALTAYTVAYGSHERTLDLESIRRSDDASW
jgi:hypothetical protein